MTFNTLQTVLTCDVINRAESNAKLPYFEWIIFLLTLLEVLYPSPVLRFELSIIVGQESWALESLQSLVHQWLCSVLPTIKIETHCLCTSIIGILNNFLCMKNREIMYTPSQLTVNGISLMFWEILSATLHRMKGYKKTLEQIASRSVTESKDANQALR